MMPVKQGKPVLKIVFGVVALVAGTVAPAAAPLPLADPFILSDGGKYYAYGTSSPSGIVALVSDDLKTWSWPEGRAGYLALDKQDSFGARGFWAPEVYRVGNEYLMFYSAEEHVCVATSASPLGPFRQDRKEPLLKDRGNIDSSLFRDDDGRPYLFWVHYNNRNEIWMAELEPDCRTIRPGTAHLIAWPEQPWELVFNTINEGPFVVKHGGTYYLTYSGNGYTSPNYGIGCATAKSVAGPWVKYADNPVFQSPGGLVGVGHHALFTDKDGVRRIVFHAHNSVTNVHPRLTHIGTYAFEKRPSGPDRLVVDKAFFTPVLRP